MSTVLQSRPATDERTLYLHRILGVLGGDPGRAVLVHQNRAITARSLLQAISGMVDRLDREGVEPGTTVAVLTSPNHPMMLVARFAAHLLGAAVVHIRSMNPRSDADRLSADVQADVLRATGASLLVVDVDSAERGVTLALLVPALRVLLDAAPRTHLRLVAPYRPDGLAMVDFTSGTTSGPKMVRQSFGTRETHIGLLERAFAHGPAPTVLAVTPIGHTLAPMVDAALANAGAVVLHEGFDSVAVAAAIAEHSVTDLYLAVPQLYALLDLPFLSPWALRSLRRVVYSGTPIAPSRVAAALALFGSALTQVYGTTEAGGISSLTGLDHYEPELHGTVGRPFPWVQLEIRSEEDARVCRRGDVGEVCVRSATVMQGYLGDPAGSTRTLVDGWLRTGDLGLVDDYGYLRLEGRVGQVIKSQGLKLHPALIEETLLSHPQVRNVAVYGVRDADFVEHVHAVVELRQHASPAELQAHVVRLLSPAHAPAVLRRLDRIPLTPDGKPDYTRLRTGDFPP